MQSVSSKERQRRYRQNKREGNRVLRGGLAVDQFSIDALIRRGHLPNTRSDTELLDGISGLIDRLAESDDVTRICRAES
jgi:hypothetical protein